MQDDNALEKELKYEILPPPPVPGLFYMEMVPNIETQSHCSLLDQDYKSIYTPLTDYFPVDILAGVREIEQESRVGWLNKDISSSAYDQEKLDRNELLMRNEQKHHIEDVLNFQEYRDGTFKTVQESCGDYEIEEEYQLVPSQDQFIIVTGNVSEEDANARSFSLETSETSLIDRCMTENKAYNSTKLHVEDKICIEIRDGKAFYSLVKYAYKFDCTDKR